MDTVGRLLSVVFGLALAIGWIAILLPGVVKRLRRDPTPTVPPVPLAQPMGPDGATNASVFCEAIKAVVPESVLSRVEEPNEIGLSSPLASGVALVLTWDNSRPAADSGTFYVELSELASDAFYELGMDTELSSVFWIAVGYLREGPVERQGHAWIYVREVGIRHRLSASQRVSDFEPAWVTRLPG